MYSIKRIVAVVLLLVVVGLGTPRVFADDGPTETPTTGTQIISTDGSDDTGPTETPTLGTSIITYLISLIP